MKGEHWLWNCDGDKVVLGTDPVNESHNSYFLVQYDL